MRILFDSKDPFYKMPFGTLLPGEGCRVRIKIPFNCRTKTVALCLLREDGSAYASFFLKKEREEGDYECFRTRFALPEEGLYFYHFAVETENETFRLYRQGFRDTNMEEGENWQISCIPADFTTPEETRGRVMYQIFPDRFFQKGKPDLSGKLLPFSIHENKKDIPEFLPDEKGEVKNCDFFGGNLSGIEAKLPYLASLGVKVIYLNPIFKAWSNHRYDTADYKKIDEMLGTEADFSRLCKRAHKMGMKIILDGVFSHTGANSRYFDAKGVFGHGAVSDPASPYISWFEFQEYPSKYTSWWGISTLPCTRETDEGFLDYIIRDEDSVIARWLRAGADGWRLDVADELPDAFISLLRERIKKLRPDALLIGEVWEDASNKISYGARRKYFTAGELDSVMNYPFRSAILNFVCGKDGGADIQKCVMDIVENYPEEVVQSLMNMLSTHDTPRLLSLLSPTPAPEKKEDRAGYKMSDQDRDVAMSRLELAFFLQFVLPGMPCIYYGDEVGTEGFEDPFCRSFFDWGKTENNPLTDFIRTLSALRNGKEALRLGKTMVETDGKGRLLITRSLEGRTLCAVANTGEPLTLSFQGEILLSKTRPEEKGPLSIPKNAFLLYEEKN